jgi:methionyl-tRNA formyltransferase
VTLRALLVTSRVTFVPGNYDDLVCGIADSPHIVGLLELDNASAALAGRALGLAAFGARRLGAALLTNMLGRSAGRRRRVYQQHGKDVFSLDTINGPEALDLVRRLGVDLLVNARTRYIYKPPILAAPRLGCINVHHGLLPEQRGTMCDLWALRERRPAGFSVHAMTAEVDAGAILATHQVDDGSERNYAAYLARSTTIEQGVLRGVLDEIDRAQAVTGHPNIGAPGLAHYKTPGRDEISAFRRDGIVL